jgi:hypothetical protein
VVCYWGKLRTTLERSLLNFFMQSGAKKKVGDLVLVCRGIFFEGKPS